MSSNPASIPRLVSCASHGLVPGYVICSCVLLFAEPIAHIEPPATGKLGEILCKRLANHGKGDEGVYEYRLLCKQCAKDMGLTKIGARRIK